MDIQDMRIFARVAAVQNLSAVGSELGLTPGTISKRIQSLEDELSARLFDRTTRSIRITEEGAAFLAHVERILSEIEAARASVDDKVSKPKGKLKIAAPACLGRRYVAPALCEFVRAFPEIDVQVDLHDRQVNLQEDGYDLAIRTGALSDSSLIAKRLAPDRHVIAASAAYLARAGRPLMPDDLVRHQCLVLGETRQWSCGSTARSGPTTASCCAAPPWTGSA
jgi:DNA-binding transcriptional LysR family regulator